MEEKFYKFEKIHPNAKTVPHPRSGHRLVATNGHFYSIGGYNPDFWGVENSIDTCYPLFKELWKYNIAKRKWIRMTTKGIMPSEMASHAALLHGSLLILYGGTGIPFGTAASNDIHICNLKTSRWSRMMCEADNRPIKTYGHAMTLHGKYLYIVGGTTGWEYNSETHRFDLEAHQWELCDQKQQKFVPEGRYRHEIVAWKDKLHVFGGGTGNTVFNFDPMPVFDMKTSAWEPVCCQPHQNKGFPPARRCHSCVQHTNYVYITGGLAGDVIFDDLWRFDLDLLQWCVLPHRLPQPVYFHAAALTPAGCLYVYGGVTEIDSTRTSDIYRLWVKTPSLKEICWDFICQHFTALHHSHPRLLLKIGIPPDLVERLS